jgi:hypothetical protein
MRRSHFDSIDVDQQVISAHGLTAECQDSLDERNTAWQITAPGEQGRKRLGRHRDDEVCDR